jgi:diguanylate cyclase (GGDEF)-like protein
VTRLARAVELQQELADQAPEPHDLYPLVTERLGALVDAAAATLHLAEGAQLVSTARFGESCRPTDLALARRAMETGQITVDPDSGSLLVVPLLFRGKALGVLVIEAAEGSVFDGHDVHLLGLVRGVAASQVHHTSAVAAQRRSQAVLERMALTDALTGLSNRTALRDRLRHAISRLDRRTGCLGVVLVDLDRFKVVNDTAGHAVGDRLLREAGRRLVATARPSDTVARLGGDEFVVLVEDAVDVSDVLGVAERFRVALSGPLAEVGVQLAASVGVTVAADVTADTDELLRQADLALYRAKELGRGRVVAYDGELRAALDRRMGLERQLRSVLDDGLATVRYQPVISLATGRVTGAEALFRSSAEDMATGAMVDVAEETGMVVRLDTWVCRQAIGAAERLGLDHVAVNASARSLADASYLEAITDSLACSNPGALRVELTERTLLHDDPTVLTALATLRRMGVALGIDDFGTGYAALAYLSRFDLQFLKLDASFVADVGISLRARAVAEAVCRLAHALDLEVVAEGVETTAQLQALRELGCDLGQGYLWAPALGEAELAVWLASRRGEAIPTPRGPDKDVPNGSRPAFQRPNDYR